MACGARCDQCFLRLNNSGGPVGPELRSGSAFLIVGECPGDADVKNGRTSTGDAGLELDKALGVVGLTRPQVSYTNALMCRPKAGDWAKLKKDMRQLNEIRKHSGLEALPPPWQCCRPRLLNEMSDYSTSNVLTLGAQALFAVTNCDKHSVTASRGFPMRLEVMPDGTTYLDEVPLDDAEAQALAEKRRGLPRLTLTMMATVHPNFVIRRRRWTQVFRNDIHHGLRVFRGQNIWTPPNIIYAPDVATIERTLLGEPWPFYLVDTETDGKYPLQANLRCVGVGRPEGGIVIPVRGIDGSASLYTEDQTAEIGRILREFLVDPKRIKAGNNVGVYDRIQLFKHYGVWTNPVLDTMLLHRAVASELPHGLGFIASLYTVVPMAWKKAHTATEAQTDQELHEYNGLDITLNSRVIDPLMTGVQLREQIGVVAMDHQIQEFCAEMHVLGMPIDQKRRAERQKLARFGETDANGDVKTKGLDHYVRDCRQASGWADHNPNSRDQVAEILFNRWGLPCEDFTESGVASTADGVLLKLLGRKKLKPFQREYLLALRGARSLGKELGTYILKLKRCDELLRDDEIKVIQAFEKELDEDGEVSERTYRKVQKLKYGCVGLDNRLHTGWNAHVAVSGRLSSSDPINATNFPKHLRDIVQADEGDILVGADMDQVELRYVAALARSSVFLTAFHATYKLRKAGKEVDKLDHRTDPYSGCAALTFPKEWDGASAESKDRIRTFAKIFTLACLYGAEPITIWDILRATEDKSGRLIYLDLTLQQTRERYDAWCEANWEIVRWWDEVWSEYKRQGYLLDPTVGRRRDFLDGGEDVRNEVLNFKAQAGASALVHKATIEIRKTILPFRRWGVNTGIINQCHDSLTAQVPLRLGPSKVKEMEEAMESRVPGLDVVFTASGKCHKKWNKT